MGGNGQGTIGRLLTMERLACERRLSDFIRQTWRVIEPQTIYIPNWHIDLLAEFLGSALLLAGLCPKHHGAV